MPLRSELFSDSRELQACLVSDASHVVPGARGDHVARIQSALVRLRVLEADDARAEAGHYGPRTTEAVLTYKRAFKIINRSYQNSADNVVGRMTIASLDDAIFVLDGGGTGRRLAPFPGPHPVSPANGSKRPAHPKRLVPPFTSASALVSAPASSSGRAPLVAAPVTAPGGDAFGPPISTLPQDIQDVIRRSNAAKKPGIRMLAPYIEDHEGPLPGPELTKRFAGGHSVRTVILTELHARMAPFDIWKNIKTIEEVFFGTGSKGIFCQPFDHNLFLDQMEALTKGPRIGPDPNVVPVSVPLSDSKFCRDAFNVHGPRDSFREIVKQGPGLHICIAQPAVRATLTCDLHIDEIQQGQVCSRGLCIPILNGQTIDHLRTVGPWLAKKAKDWLPKP
ncbi:MAG: hypothetical protein BGN99_19175 [Alphaproteobacteria bacterium 65-37]|nr:MAG: hypothetical protein BGN99_19175 [Alphaproteobacteria bacterium 65-37]